MSPDELQAFIPQYADSDLIQNPKPPQTPMKPTPTLDRPNN